MKKKLGQDTLHLLHNLMETPLADVILVMESGEFLSLPPEEAVKEGEVVIGELTVFEKALITVRGHLADKANLISETNNKMVTEACAAGTNIDKAKVLENKTAHKNVSITIEAFDNLFLSSILSRLGKDVADGHDIGIRKGYLVVRSSHKKKCGGIHVIHVSME